MYNVLITDDENKSRLLIENIVKQILPDINVWHADHPLEAIRLVEEIKFDLMFIDMVMPQMNGLEVIEQISNMEHQPFIIIVSAHKNFEFAQKGVNLGASGYISKPIYLKQFIPIIGKFIEKHSQVKTTETNSGKVLYLPTHIGFCLIKTDNIVFIEKNNRNMVDIYTTEEVITRVRGTLTELSNQLPSDFIYINRQCIVKKDRIKYFNPKTKQITVKVGETEKELTCSRTTALTITKSFKLLLS